jgi:hypothetical protein
MTIIFSTKLQVGTDQIIKGQGMDPETVKRRSPKLYQYAEDARCLGVEKLYPRVAYKKYDVLCLNHNRINLSEGQSLRGELLVKYLGNAGEIIVAVCTVGNELEDIVSETFGNHFCGYVEKLAGKEGKKSSVPINPGMEGWSVEEGQPQIFQLVDASKIDVTLSENCLMRPLKSISMLIGIGDHLDQSIKPCDLCSIQKTCRYRK